MWPEYTHMFGDEELQEVATRLGVFWQRRDLKQIHHHFTRADEGGLSRIDWVKGRREMPEFLREPNSPQHWEKYSALFRARKAAGFPGATPR
jgi:hypothetical protein